MKTVLKWEMVSQKSNVILCNESNKGFFSKVVMFLHLRRRCSTKSKFQMVLSTSYGH